MSTSPVNSPNQLHPVERVSKDEKKDAIVKTLEKWEESAFEKALAMQDETQEAFPFGYQRMLCCITVSKESKNLLRSPSSLSNFTLCCCEVENQVQAVALAKITDYVEIGFIVTNPDNIACSVNDGLPRFKGAGSSLINYFSAMCLQNPALKGISLDSLDSSSSFYTERGFEIKHQPTGPGGIPSLRRSPLFVLSAEKIHALSKEVG